MQPDYDTVLDRIPPQNLDAEQAVLGAMLLGGDAAKEALAVLRAEDFYRDAHKHIFEAVCDLVEQDEPVDIVTVSAQLKALDRLESVGGLDYLERLAHGTPYSANIAKYAAIVHDRSQLRELLFTAQRIAQHCYDPLAEGQEAIERAEADIAALAIGSTVNFPVTTLRDIGEKWRRGETDRLQNLTTGFPTLDQWTHGGYCRPMMYVIAADPKGGKTSWMLNSVKAVCESAHRVGILSLEMPEGELHARLLALGCGVPWWAMDRGPNEIDRDDWQRYAMVARDELDRTPGEVVIIDDAGYDTLGMVARLRHLRETCRCELLVMDLFNNVGGRGETAHERFSDVALTLEQFAKRMKVPILVTAQLNREGRIKETATLEERARVLMRIEDHSRLVVFRSRDGRTGPIEMRGNVDTLKFVEAPDQGQQSDSWTPDSDSHRAARRASGERYDDLDGTPNERRANDDPFGNY